MLSTPSRLSLTVLATTAALMASAGTFVGATAQQSRPASPVPVRTVLDQYCVSCHNGRVGAGSLILDQRDLDRAGADQEIWEKVVKKLQAGAMPPAGSRRPDGATSQALIAAIEDALDRAAKATPNPGRPPVHRLNRLEYTNAIRDIFGFEIDGRALLPADDAGFGFDNIADVLSVSPGLLDRYLLAATKISRLGVGDQTMRAGVATYHVGDQTLGQDDRMSEELPFGSRGGIAVRHYFPLDGEYRVRFLLQRSDVADSNVVRGLDIPNLIDVRVDRARVGLFPIGGPDAKGPTYRYQSGLQADEDFSPDATAEARFSVKAGAHVVGISLNKDSFEMEGVGASRLPLTSELFNRGRNTSGESGKIDMTIQKVFIAGPFEGKTPVDSAVYRRVFVCRPASTSAQSATADKAARDEEPCARRILSTLARRAYRRPVTAAEADALVGFYRAARADGSFDSGIQAAIARMLVDVRFLFRVEPDPQGAVPGTAYPLTDVGLASRMSFFLWSSIPDDELLRLAEQGRLRQPAVLEQQVRRMIADPKSDVLVNNFFGQWLYLRNMETVRPDPHLFTEFDENLRSAFQRETELFLKSQLRDDRPATELLTANYTFVNERLARHYGIGNVVGSHFRRVTLPDTMRGGLLGHGSILTVTSYADRTSVVTRGKYILQNLLGIPPPPPPADVPPLDDTVVKGSLRQRMEAHRKNPVCASCHNAIDPLGFALENFDGIGKFRTVDGDVPVDASGVMVDGTKFDSPAAFRRALVTRQSAFLTTLTEKLLTYAVGRGVEPFDMPAVRQILKDAARDDYRWSALILGIVRSPPFQMRRAES